MLRAALFVMLGGCAASSTSPDKPTEPPLSIALGVVPTTGMNANRVSSDFRASLLSAMREIPATVTDAEDLDFIVSTQRYQIDRLGDVRAACEAGKQRGVEAVAYGEFSSVDSPHQPMNCSGNSFGKSAEMQCTPAGPATVVTELRLELLVIATKDCRFSEMKLTGRTEDDVRAQLKERLVGAARGAIDGPAPVGATNKPAE